MKKLVLVMLLICTLALCLSACGQTCNHSFSEWIIVTQPSCIAQGQQMRICSLCQGQEWLPVKKVGHSYGKNGKCTLCGATEGVIYQISDDGTYAIVVGYSGTATNVKIAATYDGLPVRAICDRAFDSNAITSVAIPDSITTISGSAFGDCRNLTNIAVAEGNQNYCSIDCNLYSKDGKTLVQYAVGKSNTSFTVPDSVTAIGDSAFTNCTKLTSVTLGNSVITIGNDAFAGCSKLTSVTLGNSVASIGGYAFYGCNLKNVYYTGSAEEWKQISINNGNNHLTKATIHYNYVPEHKE